MGSHGTAAFRGRILPLLPLKGLSVFPATAISIQIGRRRSLNAVQEALNSDGFLVLATQKDAQVEEPDTDDIFSIGTLAAIKRVTREENGVLAAVVEGMARVHLAEFTGREPYFRVRVEAVPELDSPDLAHVEGLVQVVFERYERFLRLNRSSGNATVFPVQETEPGRIADIIAANSLARVEDRQALLETASVKERLEKLAGILFREAELLELERKIQQRIRLQVEKSQREYYLKEQIKAIKRELGEDRDETSEADELRARVDKAGMPEAVRQKAMHEINRLEKMPIQSAEAVVARHYLDWLIALPWSARTDDSLDVAAARKVLDEEHHGLDRVKKRVIEILAVRKLVSEVKGPILCLIGPPGVGKTSLARSIARAMGRRFVRVSLGGIRDEAEIRGHRRTYVGAMPGRIIQGMRQAGSHNPVFLLDEIDKMSVDFRGDPAAALLEVLDPEQNVSFSDHYVEVPYDLSNVLFITTANGLYNVSRALLDRMELIVLPGYIEEEKVAIAVRHLWPRQLAAHGLGEADLRISEEAMRTLIRNYTREAGVRGLERQLAAICRKVSCEVAENGRPRRPKRVTARNLEGFLGPAPFRYWLAEGESQVGVCTGVGWTEYGGDLMSIEVGIMPGNGLLQLTGKLGEVMKESAQAGYSFIRARAAALGIDPRFHEKVDLHIHVLEGAVPKDGPSAGITMATAVISALTNIPVRRDVAMTGEITLRGSVLPVGGIRDKVLAAHRAGITTMILPEQNRGDVAEVPDKVRKQMRFVFVSSMEQVLPVALRRKASPRRKTV